MSEKEKQMELEHNKKEKSRRLRKKEEKSGERKARFTVLDFFLVMVALLCILGIGFRTTIADLFLKAEPLETVVISFKAEGLTPKVAEQIKKGDKLTYDGKAFGTLQNVTVEEATAVIVDGDAFVSVNDPNSCSVKGTLAIQGRYTESGLVTGDDVGIYVGKIIKISTSKYSLTVKITEIPRN